MLTMHYERLTGLTDGGIGAHRDAPKKPRSELGLGLTRALELANAAPFALRTVLIGIRYGGEVHKVAGICRISC
jgi:hypothetical protein